MTAKTTNWAQKTKAQTGSIAVSNNGDRKDRGRRLEGILANAELTSYSTGSYGFLFRYEVDDNGNKKNVYENVVIKKMTDEGELIPTKYGAKTLERRLLAFGLTADEINSLGIPKSPKAEYNLTPVIGAGVAVYCRDAEYKGRPKLEVNSVFPLDGNADAASA